MTHGGVGEGAIGKVLCGEATDMSFGDTAICQSTGYWHITEFVCWYLMQDGNALLTSSSFFVFYINQPYTFLEVHDVIFSGSRNRFELNDTPLCTAIPCL